MTDVAGSDLKLPEIDLMSAAFNSDPERHLAEARKQGWLARSAVGYVVLTFKDMREFLQRDAELRSPNADVSKFMQAENSPWGQWNANQIQGLSGERHLRIRKLIASAFTPRVANFSRPLMREIITEVLDEWAPKGTFDFAEFAAYYPVQVLCRVIGAPQVNVQQIRTWLDPLGGGFDLDPSLVPALDEGLKGIWGYVEDLVADRRANTRQRSEESKDLLDRLIEANLEGDKLSDDELINLLILLIGAGYDTSKNMMAMVTHILLNRPGDWKKMGEDFEFAKMVLEETLRYRNVLTTYRVTNGEFRYRGAVFPKDTWFVLPLSLAGQDEGHFDHAEVFDPHREFKRTLAFGGGGHMCVGQFIARAQLEEALPIIARRLKNPRLVGDVTWRSFPGIWGIRTLPIAFEDASA